MLRLTSGEVRPCAAEIITTKPRPSSTQPIAIFVRLEGSWLRARCHDHRPVSTGVKNQIMNGLNAWYHVDGMPMPKNVHRVLWSAQSWSVLPCCSYTPQHDATMKHATQTAITRLPSSLVMGCFVCTAAALRCVSTSGA